MSRKPTRRDLLRWFGSGAALALGGFAFGEADSNSIEVVRKELLLPKWDADGFKVAAIADIHVVTPHAVARAQQAFEMAVAERPDVIVVLGDFVDKSPTYALHYIEKALDPLHQAKCPVVAVMGNHDYWAAHPAKVIAAVRAGPLKLLRNEWVDVGGVGIMGLDDAIANLHRPEKLLDEGLPRSMLCLLHEPDFVDQIPRQASLQLSGHSHGGQICLPMGIALHTPRGALRYISGYYPDARVPLYVTRGVGTIGPDLRMFCRPEVTVLTLRSA